MVYAHWMHMQITGAPERILNFAMMTHPAKNLQYRVEVAELMRFFGEEVSTWVGPRGQPVIAFVTDEGLADAYIEWEAENPGTSSFSFDYEAHSAGNTQPYPYALPGISRGLRDAEFQAVVGDLGMAGVTVVELRYREVFRISQPGLEPPMKITGIGALLQEVVYLVLAESPSVIDLSPMLDADVYVKMGDTGEVLSAQATAISAGVIPILVSTTSSHF